MLVFEFRNFVIYFDFVIEGSKSINSLTTSKLVSMVKSCLRMFLIFSSCNTNIKMFCSDNFLPLSWEQNVQKHSNKCSVSSFISVLDGAFGVCILNMG